MPPACCLVHRTSVSSQVETHSDSSNEPLSKPEMVGEARLCSSLSDCKCCKGSPDRWSSLEGASYAYSCLL